MGTMSFRSDDPSLNALDVDHPNIDGYSAERLMFHPAYLDRNHPLHARAVSDVRAHFERLYGTGAMPSGSSPTMSFDTTTGEPIVREMVAPMVASGDGVADEHNKVD
jgi:hypothetical protein